MNGIFLKLTTVSRNTEIVCLDGRYLFFFLWFPIHVITNRPSDHATSTKMFLSPQMLCCFRFDCNCHLNSRCQWRNSWIWPSCPCPDGFSLAKRVIINVLCSCRWLPKNRGKLRGEKEENRGFAANSARHHALTVVVGQTGANHQGPVESWFCFRVGIVGGVLLATRACGLPTRGLLSQENCAESSLC